MTTIKLTTQYKPFIPKGKRFFVYVAGPISKGSWDGNMLQATRAFNMFVYGGLIPFVPHATSALNHLYVSGKIEVAPTDDYNFWLGYDFSYLRDVMHAMLRLPGESWGTDREEEYMRRCLNKPVFDTVEEIFDYAESRGYEINRELAAKFGEEFDAVYNTVSQTSVE